MKIAKLMTQSPEDIRTDGALLEQDPDELRKAKKRVEEDGFKLIRPEQAYINFSQASKYINTLDVEVLQKLGVLPSVFLHDIPSVASPLDWNLWTLEGYSNLVYMAVHSGKYDQSSFATIKEAAPEEEVELDEEGNEIEKEGEVEPEEIETSEIWGTYPVIKSHEKIQVLKTVMSPLTVFPSQYLFEEYYPEVLRMRFGMPEGNSDYAYWIRHNMDVSYLKMIWMDAYEEYDRNGPEAGLEIANQRLMLSSSVVRNVTATKSSVFSENVGTFSPMKELLSLPLNSGDRVFMSLALGGGKSTELHVAQCESVCNSMSLVAKHLTPEILLEYADIYWGDDNQKMLKKIEIIVGLIDEVLDSENKDLIRALVKDAAPSYDISEWSERDKSVYKQLIPNKPETALARNFCKVYFWRKKIQKFVDRVDSARSKASWTGTLMEMTLTKTSPRLTESKVPWITFLDVVEFIEAWRDHDPKIERDEVIEGVMDARIFNMLPEPFKKGLYHDLRVIHVSNNEELDAFVKTYTMFDLDSSTVQALNSNNVSGLSRDESILMRIPCPVVTAQRRNWNATEFFGSRMQVRTSVFDERSSSDPVSLNLNEWAYCWDITVKNFGETFFRRAIMDKDLTINILEFRTTIFQYFYEELKMSLSLMIQNGKSKSYVRNIEPILRLAAASSNYPSDDYIRLLENHFPLDERLEEIDPNAFIENDHQGLRKLCLSSSKVAVDTIFEIINKSDRKIRQELEREADEERENEEDNS